MDSDNKLLRIRPLAPRWWRRLCALFARKPRASRCPMAEAVAALDPSLSSAEAYYRGAAKSRFPGKRILVLEDNEACGEILRNFMARWEMEVTMVASCREAFSVIDGASEYDFAVLDHTLGDGTGDDVARALRDAGLARHCAVVSLTGNRYLPDKALYDATIEKPISPETLRSTLIDLLDQKEAQSKTMRVSARN